VHTQMKPFAERNKFVIGAVGIVAILAIVLFGFQYKKIPFISSASDYSAYFTEAGGLKSGAAVQVAGYRVGEVTSVELDGARVLVEFEIEDNVRLGDRTEANIRTKSLLGSKVLEVTPRGDGQLSTIPIERTRAPYELPDALGDLSSTISDLNTNGVSDAMETLAETFRDTPPELKVAVEGVARFSETLGTRDEALRRLLANAKKATGVLSERADQIVSLIADSNALLAQLMTESAALDQLSGNLSVFARQLSGFISDNRETLRPALEKLNGVLTIVDNRKTELQESIKLLNQYALSLGECLTAGPYFMAALVNLVPGQFVQPFIDAAFSDLGLDPATLLPSQRTDPQVGQPGTPALPIPFPRTGQGGEPHLTLPDAITGKPGDPRYPYREPLPAPPPGGPPPGPPAVEPGQDGLVPVGDTPSIHAPAPGEPPASTSTDGGQ
jgi:phospholipid/cholesterol/gamma-HCH transport system substrate-binding protein